MFLDLTTGRREQVELPRVAGAIRTGPRWGKEGLHRFDIDCCAQACVVEKQDSAM